MQSTARSFDIDDDDRFCHVVQVEPPLITAEASIVIPPTHTTVEMTVATENNSAQNQNV